MTAETSPVRTPAPRPKSVVHDPEAPSPAVTRRLNRSTTVDPLSDRTTTALIRRTLCSSQRGDKARDAQVPIEELLPPLTSRNDVDLQLYAILAIVLREFVQSWYNKITTDENFVAEIIHIIAHCSRALEQRFRKVDLESLVLDEIPDLLDKHITACRTANNPIALSPVTVDFREVYHALCPLPHLAPVPRLDDPLTISTQRENEALYRQLLVQGMLAILLPTEDLENPCLTTLVEQILSELIIGNIIANKASQPWLLYEGICIIARVVQQKKEQATEVSLPDDQPLDANLLVKSRRRWSVRSMCLGVIQLGMLLVGSLRFITTALVMASSLPARGTPMTRKPAATDDDEKVKNEPMPGPRPYSVSKVPIMSFRLWSCLGNLLELHMRMPWLDGFLSLLHFGAVHGPGRIAGHDGPIDRLLSYHVQSLFSPSNLPPLLRTLRGVLFPNNAPGQSTLSPPSSDAELQALRRRASNAIWSMLPKGVGRVYLGGRLWKRGGESSIFDEEEEELVDEIERLLMVLDDEYCNKHLMYSILELVLIRVMPELTEKGVAELWEERLG